MLNLREEQIDDLKVVKKFIMKCSGRPDLDN